MKREDVETVRANLQRADTIIGELDALRLVVGSYSLRVEIRDLGGTSIAGLTSDLEKRTVKAGAESLITKLEAELSELIPLPLVVPEAEQPEGT